jgi:hypothetical protein
MAVGTPMPEMPPGADAAPCNKLLKGRSHHLDEEAARGALGDAGHSVRHNLTM